MYTELLFHGRNEGFMGNKMPPGGIQGPLDLTLTQLSQHSLV